MTVARSPFTVLFDHGALPGELVEPEGASLVVAFVHGSGSSRYSTRNRAVAQTLVDHGMATLLIDLLTEREAERDEVTSELRFDIPFISARTTAIIDALAHDSRSRDMTIGLFGASTGAAAALVAASRRPDRVRAIVSRGGRPDLAGSALPLVRAPTLFIVGGADVEVLALNRRAMRAMRAPCELTIVPGATHLFEEPGALQRVADLAADWLAARHDRAPSQATTEELPA